MGIGGLHIWHLLILAVIVLLLFGTNKLRNVGSDLGAAIKGFKRSMADEDATPPPSGEAKPATPHVDGEQAKPRATVEPPRG